MYRIVIAALALAAAVATVATTATAGEALEPGSFELTLEGSLMHDYEVILPAQGTFSSRAPFCATGTFADDWELGGGRRFTCDDGTGSLTVAIAQAVHEYAPPWETTWRILDGSGSYGDLRGKGSLRGELLGGTIEDWSVTWRSTFQGAVGWDAVAPTIDISSARATKLRRPAGAYSIKLALALRDHPAGSPVSYTLRATTIHRGIELARRVGATTNPMQPLTLRIYPPRVKAVRLQLAAEDQLGNASSLTRTLKLHR